MPDPAMRRPDIYREPLSQDHFGVVQKPLTGFERLYNQGWLRKIFVLAVIAALWECYALWLDNELLVPTFSATVRALVDGMINGVILSRALYIPLVVSGNVTFSITVFQGSNWSNSWNTIMRSGPGFSTMRPFSLISPSVGRR